MQALTARLSISRNDPERVEPAPADDPATPDADDAVNEGRTRRWVFAASHTDASYSSLSAQSQVSSVSDSSGAESPMGDIISPTGEHDGPFRLDADPAAVPARTSLYPNVTGPAVDRGRAGDVTVRRLLTPLLANEPWDELLADCNLSAAELYGDARPSLSDMGSVAQLADLLDYLARACRPARSRAERRAIAERSFSLKLERLSGAEGTLEIVATLSAPEQGTQRPSSRPDGPPDGSVLVVTMSLRIASVVAPIPSPSLPSPSALTVARPARDLTAYKVRRSRAWIELTAQARIAQTPVGKLIVELDWAKTPIGAMERWSEGLLWTLSHIMASPFPMAIWIGRGFHALVYNDACPSPSSRPPSDQRRLPHGR